jgi:hypothetical protein
LIGRCDVLEGFVADDVDDRADDGPSVEDDSSEKRFQPAFGALAVSVEECDDLAFDVLCAEETSSDESGALAGSKDCGGSRNDQEDLG